MKILSRPSMGLVVSMAALLTASIQRVAAFGRSRWNPPPFWLVPILDYTIVFFLIIFFSSPESIAQLIVRQLFYLKECRLSFNPSHHMLRPAPLPTLLESHSDEVLQDVHHGKLITKKFPNQQLGRVNSSPTFF
ncbi:hypothetical protein BC939DRAFT_228394 [Gamsiella multidivaricata]|uniref:uncharacterized protein n=1 Tax=Gamsiella multidivaricata TaxID=101098 RepID=UPI002220A54C|nr:uncharacterized protein BC939DRAFT_228394 [Gamsiella multidivaricata]KAI7820670.1 hypothetical protein BC939DRAFT_228394 [Gamsiella multidivaricata]